MAKISELSGEAREKRIAELKAKMKAAAAKAKAAQEAGEAPAAAAPPPAEPAPAAAEPEAQAEPVATAEAEPEAVAEAEPTPKPAPKARPAREAAPADGNGAAAPRPAPRPAPAPQPREAAAAPPTPQEMTRREFMTYAWGAALGLLALEGGVVSFMFMYPRFRAGEFGGEFFLGPADSLPAPGADPIANSAGKFWLVTTEEGDPKALYMVCTHLGCLYKWDESNGRFECPCHGSKFTHDGYYIEGPAPRSLDHFEVSVENGEVIVDTGARITGAPATESPSRATA